MNNFGVGGHLFASHPDPQKGAREKTNRLNQQNDFLIYSIAQLKKKIVK